MSKTWLLTKVFLKNGSDSLLKGKRKNMPKVLTLALLLGVLLMSVGIPLGSLIYSGYDMLSQINQQGIILGFALALISAAIFVFGIFYVLTVFYFSKDIDYLLPLPLKPSEILGAKFVTVVVYEYYTELIFLLPVLVAYGLKSGAGVLYYIYSLIVFLVLPVIPLIIASIINMIVMRFTNLGKHKDAFKVIGGLIAMFAGVGINLYVQRGVNNHTSPEQLQKMILEGNNSLLGFASTLFPSSKLASWALINSDTTKGIVNLLLLLVVSIALLGIFLMLSEGLYLRGVVGMSESYSKRKKLTSNEFDKATVQSSALASYVTKELRILFRTPAYLMNCVIVNFLWPVFILIPIFSQKEALSSIRTAGNYLGNTNVLGIVLAASLGFSLFLAGSSNAAATSISREGQNVFVSKYLPMRYKDQIMAKVIAGVLLNALGILVILIVAEAIIQLPIYLALLIFVVGLLGITFSAFTGIFIDLNSPKLNWDNEQKAVKQNFNLIINMFLCMLVGAGAVILTVYFKLNLWQAFTGAVVIFGAADMVLYNILSTTGEKLYDKIQA